MIGIALAAVTIGLALHGLGRVVGWLIGDDDAPAALAMAWGLALYVALAGWLVAAGVLTRDVQIALALVGVGVGPVWSLRRRARWLETARGWRPDLDTAIAAAVALALMIQLAGSAGIRQGAFADGDGGLLGPLARLAQTGELGDRGGASVTGGFGGSLIVTSLGWVFGDWQSSHAIDGGLGLALAVALAFGLRRIDPARPYLGVALAAVALGLPTLAPDLAPRWTVAAMVLGVYATLRRAEEHPDRARLRWAAVFLAAACATIVFGGLGLLIVIVVASPRRGRVVAGAIAAVVIAPYLAATFGSGASFAIAWPRAGAGLAAGAVVWALLSVAIRDHGDDRPLAITVAGLGAAFALAPALARTWPTAGLAMAPFAIAGLLLVILGLSGIELRRAVVPPLAVASAFAIAMILAGLRVKIGMPPLAWGDRAAAFVDAAREHTYIHRGRGTLERASYQRAFAAIPAGARVGVWVDRGDLIEYGRHNIVELRARRPLPRGLDYLVIAPSAPLRPDDPIATATGRIVDGGDLTVIALTP